MHRIFAFLAILGLAGIAGAEPGLPDRTSFEAFIDGVMAGHEAAYPYAGAVVAVVANGEVYFTKGYGAADHETGAAVDPERTLFRIGSVSKLFTWTALMQQFEQGRVQLDQDVNAYLSGIEIPDTFEAPITLNHLMNHTAGFEDRFLWLFSRTPTDQRLAEILADQLPARVRPPGLVTAYSNHGTALAALALEGATGVSWADYVEAHILQPLGMKHTTVRQPIPESLAADMSKGYANRNGLLVEQGFEFVPLAPAGSVSATATDMARFMIAHLQYGEFDGQRILTEATAERMQLQSFQNAPGLNGLAHGFMEMDRNGHRVIGHGGDTFWFHTVWAILPEHGVGFFAAYNTDAGAEARTKLFEAFMDRYFPRTGPRPVPELRPGELDRFEGVYRANRMAHSTLEKMAALAGGVRVEATDDGALVVRAQETLRMGEIEPLVFREFDGPRTVRFQESGGGKIDALFMNEIPVFGFNRTPWNERPELHALLLVLTVPLLMSGVVVWPFSFWRRRKDEPAFSQDHLPGAAKWTAGLASLAFVLFAVGFASVMTGPEEIVYGLPPMMPALLVLPLIGTALTYVAVLFAFLFCVRRIATLQARIHYVAVAIACAITVWQLHTWNLLGFRY
jgi:CubicO group peptidase (beta-lactamase class C family)